MMKKTRPISYMGQKYGLLLQNGLRMPDCEQFQQTNYFIDSKAWENLRLKIFRW